MGQATKLIQPPQDIIAFVKTLHIPETLTVSKHVFSPPQPADPAQVRMKFCTKVCNKYMLQCICYSHWANGAQNGVISIWQWGVFTYEKGAI